MRHSMQKDLSECQIIFYDKKIYLWNINFLGGVQTGAFPLQAQGKKWRWYPKHKPDCEVWLALPSLLKRQPKLEHLNGFFLKDSVLWYPARSLSCSHRCLAPSCYLSAVSPDWSLKLDQVPCALSAPCSGRPWAAPVLLIPAPFVGDMPQVPGDNQGVSHPAEKLHFISKCENVSEKDSPSAGQQHSTPRITLSDLLLCTEASHFALPSVLLPTTHFQSFLVLISFPSGISPVWSDSCTGLCQELSFFSTRGRQYPQLSQ